MPLTWKVYVDLEDGDGTPDDDLSAYWMATDLVQGLREEGQLIADAGRCVITLKNDDRRFSPAYASGPHYGDLVGGRAALVSVVNDGGDAIAQFRGVVAKDGWQPAAGRITGPFTCRVVLEDALRQLQESDITLTLLQDVYAPLAIKYVVNQAYKSGLASGYVLFRGPVDDADYVTLYDAAASFPWSGELESFVYTFKDSLTGAANEVLIESDSDGSDITPEHLAAAINHDEGEASKYGTGTVLNPHFSAVARPRIGTDLDDRDGWTPLQDTGSGYEALAASFILTTDTITTDEIDLYLRKQGSPTGTATVTLILNALGLPNDVQYTTVTGTFEESAVSGAGGWVRVTLSDYVTFYRHQRYHVQMTTDRAAHATNYIEWGTYSGGSGASVQSSGTWTGLGAALVWCIPGRVDFTARLHTSALGTYRVEPSNTDDMFVLGTGPIPPPPNMVGSAADALSGLTDYNEDDDAVQVVGDLWRTTAAINAHQALRDLVESSRGMLWVAEDGTLTYQPRGWLTNRVSATPAITLDNEQNATAVQAGRELTNRVSVEYAERREVENTVIARAGGVIVIPPNVAPVAGDFNTEATQGKRWNPHDDVERTTVKLPFVDDETGIVTGAKDVIQPVPGTDFTLWADINGRTLNVTYLALTRGLGFKVTTAVLGGEIECTFRNPSGIATLYVHDLQVRGTALKTLNPQQVVYQDDTSVAAYGVRERTLRLPSLTEYGLSLADSLARYEVERAKDARAYIGAVAWRGQTTAAGVKLYSVGIGDVIRVTEDQTAVEDQNALVIGRQIHDDKGRNEPRLTWQLRPLSDQPYWVLEDDTYGELPARLGL